MFELSRHSCRSLLPLQICFKSLSTSSVKCGALDKLDKYLRNRIVAETIMKKEYLDSIRKKKKTNWNEQEEIFILKRKSANALKHEEHPVELIKSLQNLNNFPLTAEDWLHFFKRRMYRNLMLEQKFLPERVAVLKPDLAATHFILGRGGAVKFLSGADWVKGKKGEDTLIPDFYVPGFYVEKINAENTELIYEGLKNLCSLRHLKWLSLKGLEEIDDWCLDFVSKEYYKTLEHLDISNCKNVTYRALSSFYRFEQLKTLVVEGIPDKIEFKLACIMLQDIMPNLSIEGINLDIPKKLEPVDVDEVKEISSGQAEDKN